MGLLHLQQKMREEKEEEVQHRLDVACSPILPPPRTHLPPRIPAHLSSHHTWTPRETYPIAGETYRVGERLGETETFPQCMSRTSLDERTLILERDDERDTRDRPTNRHRERDRERELERGREHGTHAREHAESHAIQKLIQAEHAIQAERTAEEPHVTPQWGTSKATSQRQLGTCFDTCPPQRTPLGTSPPPLETSTPQMEISMPQWTPRDSGGEADTRDTGLWGEGLSILDIGANLGADTRDLQKVFSLFLNPKP